MLLWIPNLRPDLLRNHMGTSKLAMKPWLECMSVCSQVLIVGRCEVNFQYIGLLVFILGSRNHNHGGGRINGDCGGSAQVYVYVYVNEDIRLCIWTYSHMHLWWFEKRGSWKCMLFGISEDGVGNEWDSILKYSKCYLFQPGTLGDVQWWMRIFRHQCG